MKFTREQYNSMGKFGFYMDDLELEDESVDKMFDLFNTLPDNIQATAVAWGFSDTCFRDEAFTFLVKKLFGMTTDEYYNQRRKT